MKVFAEGFTQTPDGLIFRDFVEDEAVRFFELVQAAFAGRS